MALLTDRTWDQSIAEYSLSHKNPKNRFCHTVGIPLIVLSLLLVVPAIFVPHLWMVALAMFVVGSIFQFVGHAYEGVPPEFLKDWRFLFVGLRWWFAKVRGRV